MEQRAREVSVVMSEGTLENVHVLPCSTRYNGEANVRQFFENPMRKE